MVLVGRMATAPHYNNKDMLVESQYTFSAECHVPIMKSPDNLHLLFYTHLLHDSHVYL